MNKAYARLLISSMILLLITFFNATYNFFNSYTIILFLLLYLIFIYYFIGYEKNNKRYQKDILINIFIYCITYYILTYILGFFTGFNQTGYSLKFSSIIKNILPLVLMITITEIIRYIFITKGYVYKMVVLFLLINMVMLDITLLFNTYSYSILKFFLMIIIPSIAKNIFLTYVSYKVGFKPTIAYRFLFEIPVFILPIFPSFGLYIESLLGFLFPILIAFLIYNNFKKNDKKEIKAKEQKNLMYSSFMFISSLILALIVLLTSGILKYEAITIGSNSMLPYIKKGDVLIIKKLNTDEVKLLKEKDVLIFNHDGVIMVHRIVKILVVNGDKYFYTKGDNNNAPDGYPISLENVIGEPIVKIPYAGILTIEINEMTN